MNLADFHTSKKSFPCICAILQRIVTLLTLNSATHSMYHFPRVTKENITCTVKNLRYCELEVHALHANHTDDLV